MARVLVIGAGIAGCSVAWHLSKRHQVTVLEHAELPGAEASAQNAGMVRLLGEDPAERALAIRTQRWLQHPDSDWCRDELSHVTGAVLGLAHDPLHLHDGVAHLSAHGVEVRSVQGAELSAVAPALSDAPLQQAWWLPEARVVDPHALVQGFIRGLRRQGGALRCGVAVQEVLSRDGRVAGVRCAGELIEADAVVLAAGAWSAPLAQTAGVERPLYPLRRTLLTARVEQAPAAGHPWCWIDDEGVYFRPESGGWLMSACDERLDPPQRLGGSRGAPQPHERALLHDKLQRLVPRLAGVVSQGGWSGLRTFAADRSPMLGPEPMVDGLWWATGLGGYGVTCSYGVGEALAQWFDDAPPSWLHLDGVRPDRHALGRFPIRPTGQLHRPRLVDARLLGRLRGRP